MSHTTRLKGVVIRDIVALENAIKEMQANGKAIELVKDERPRMYYSDQHGVSEFVIKLPNGRYDIGLDKQADGSYLPVFDEWGGHISGQLGAACPMPNTAEGKAQHQIGQFFQAYAKHAAMNAAISQGYMVESATIDEENNVHLTLMGM